MGDVDDTTHKQQTQTRRYDVAAAADDEVHKNSLRQPTPKLRRREPQAERERERRDTHRSSHTRRSNDESERRTESRGSSRIVTRKQQLSLTHTHREKEKKEGETTHTQTREQQQQQHKKQKQKSSRRRARTPTSKAAPETHTDSTMQASNEPYYLRRDLHDKAPDELISRSPLSLSLSLDLSVARSLARAARVASLCGLFACGGLQPHRHHLSSYVLVSVRVVTRPCRSRGSRHRRDVATRATTTMTAWMRRSSRS